MIKFETLETLSSSTYKFSSFLFVENAGIKGDVLFCGCDCGQLLHSIFTNRASRMEILCRDTNHDAEVTCLMFSDNKGLCPNADGFLFSGSRDRTIKIWNPNGVVGKVHIQTCYGHASSVTSIVDGHDGTFISCSVDGSMRVWAPQRDRAILLNPFFECCFTVSTKDTWLSAMAISFRGNWGCYLGDSNGTLEIYRCKVISPIHLNKNHSQPCRKGRGTNEVDAFVASFNHQLTKFKRWENFHRLGITALHVSFDEGYLFSTSFDGTLKVSDAILGQAFFTVTNPKLAMFTGFVWLSDSSTLYLSDELGYLGMCTTFDEKNIRWTQLAQPVSEKHQADIMTSHINPVLGNITRFRRGDDNMFFVFFPPKNITQMGEVSLLTIEMDNKCVEFCGHDGSVIGIGVLDTFSRLMGDRDKQTRRRPRSVEKVEDKVRGGGGGGDYDSDDSAASGPIGLYAGDSFVSLILTDCGAGSSDETDSTSSSRPSSKRSNRKSTREIKEEKTSSAALVSLSTAAFVREQNDAEHTCHCFAIVLSAAVHPNPASSFAIPLLCLQGVHRGRYFLLSVDG